MSRTWQQAALRAQLDLLTYGDHGDAAAVSLREVEECFLFIGHRMRLRQDQETSKERDQEVLEEI